jgi:hypothetical protein
MLGTLVCVGIDLEGVMEKRSMSILRGMAIVFTVVLLASAALAENAIVVESKTVCTGAKDVVVHILLSNDAPVRHATLPLEIRSTEGGAGITSLRLSWGDRMPPGRDEPLGENPFTNQYYAKACTCGVNKVVGYGDIASTDTLSHAIKKLPVGALFSRFRMAGKNLDPGADSTGSMLLTMDIGNTPGTIVIDTMCICPSHTTMLVQHGTSPPKAIYPKFTKGVITVKACGDKK